MNIDSLRAVKDQRFKEIDLRFKPQEIFTIDQGLMEDGKIHVMVCGGTGCQASESLEIKERLHNQINKFNLQDKIEIHQTGCFGLCEVGPNIVVYPQGIFYSHVTLEDVDEIVENHFLKCQVVDHLLFDESIEEVEEGKVKPVDEVDFYKKQVRIALKHCGKIDPDNIDDYIAVGGYEALNSCLEMKPQDVIDIVKDSGLRGRGGAGFSTGLKWQFTKDAVGDKKYVACNADEGDPGAFMDRSILEGDPHFHTHYTI